MYIFIKLYKAVGNKWEGDVFKPTWLLLTGIIFILLATGCQSSAVDVTATAVATPIVAESDGAVRVGVLNVRSAEALNTQYGPLITYLSEAVGRPFTLVALDQEEQFSRIAGNNLEFILSNPLAAVQIQRLYDTTFLATLNRHNTGTQFGGLIIVRNDSDMMTLADLRNQYGGCVAFETAAGGCIFQINHLLQQNIDPYRDFANFIEIPSQDNIVLSVLNGTIDVGFIRTGQLEKMVADGIITNTDEIRILDLAEDNFLFPHTTRLYPEWPFAALEKTDPELVEAVQNALFDIPANHPALAAASIEAFVLPVDYVPIEELIQTLQLRSWDIE